MLLSDILHYPLTSEFLKLVLCVRSSLVLEIRGLHFGFVKSMQCNPSLASMSHFQEDVNEWLCAIFRVLRLSECLDAHGSFQIPIVDDVYLA